MQKTYIANGQPVILTADPDEVAVRFRAPAPHSMRAAVAGALRLGPFPERLEIPEERYTILPLDAARPGAAPLESVLSVLDRTSGVARATPVFRLGPNRLVATERVIIGFRAGADDPRPRLAAMGLEVVEEQRGRLVVRLGEYEDPFEVSERLRSDPAVRYAEPDFVVVLPQQARAGDPAAAAPACEPPEAQYALRITRAREAQQLQPGRRDVRIAIMDDGVDTLHPDLRPAVAEGFNAIANDSYQDPQPQDSHGTACAGLAAGAGTDPPGVRGVAAGCGLLAVQIARSDPLTGHWVTACSVIARALNWATDRGAHVISMSWGCAPSTAVADAILRARTEGRGGRGCVVVAGAGNHDGDVLFPASLDGVLTVAATSFCDEAKHPRSGDGETWWGSCFGPQVQIAAPGVRNYTTDNTSTGGRNRRPSPDGDYDPNFNGTSSSAPLVAGAAALVLCAHPALGEAEVRQVLCSTADRVGTDPYVDGRNHRMGHGRVNVLAAVERALELAAEADGAAGVNAARSEEPRRPAPGREAYLVVGENGAAPGHWHVLRQEADLDTILHHRAHDGRPWQVPKREGDTFVRTVTLRNLRTDALDEGSIYRVAR